MIMKSRLPREGKRVRRGALSMMTRVVPGNEAGMHNTVAKTNAAASLALAVGKEIKSLRLSLNLSANALAASAGLSNGMLSKIENGTTTPSFTTLSSLAEALRVPVARLFAGHDQRADYSLVRAGKGISVQRRGSKAGLDYELLGHLLSGDKFAEPYLVTISEDAAPSPGFQHTGIEFLHVLEGEMVYRYADTLVELGPGDTMLFDANSVHGHEKLKATPIRFLSVVFTLRT